MWQWRISSAPASSIACGPSPISAMWKPSASRRTLGCPTRRAIAAPSDTRRIMLHSFARSGSIAIVTPQGRASSPAIHRYSATWSSDLSMGYIRFPASSAGMLRAAPLPNTTTGSAISAARSNASLRNSLTGARSASGPVSLYLPGIMPFMASQCIGMSSMRRFHSSNSARGLLIMSPKPHSM